MVVLDANILIRAVLGRRVREILEAHFATTRFFAPDTAIAEARHHLPEILLKRVINPESAMTVLDELLAIYCRPCATAC
jgi:predicted nucleic acid-binding protein